MAKHRTGRIQDKEAGSGEGKAGRRTVLEIIVGAADSLYELSLETGRQVLEGLLEQDRVAMCGPKGTHHAGRGAYRYGHDQGTLVVGGRKVRVRKPRVRAVDGGELRLPTYEQFLREDPLRARVYEQMVVGVSTRKYGRSLEPLPPGFESTGTSKSEVSRNFVAQTEKQLAEFLTRPLNELDLPVVMIDGVYVGEHLLLVALGIGRDGTKHVLGLCDGATEHESTCRGLFRGLIERGLPVEQPRLFVIDGAKGLRKAIVRMFGGWALIARCRQHKVQNVLGHVPESKREWVRAQLHRAYDSDTEAVAKGRLRQLASSLERSYPTAASSVMEGIDETLTIHRLGIGPTLAKTLRSTNPIENMNGTFRHVTCRVKNWSGGRMALRWGAAALLEAESRFRRVKGFRELPGLITALQSACQPLLDAAKSSVKSA